MKYKWVLFDLDETLFDFQGSSKMALREVFYELGLNDNENTYNDYYTINSSVWRQLQEGTITAIQLKSLRWQKFLDKFGLDYNPEDLNEFYLDSLIEYTVLIPGAVDLLKALFSYLRMAIVTNGLERVQKARLKIGKLEGFFEHLIISEEIGVAKPQKAFFDFTFEKCGHPNIDEVILIGDGLSSDIKGAHDYGVDSIWYNPNNATNETGIKPTFEISDLHEVIKIIMV
jgi:YjjG family noncanonical pyrimidine nucleotidase